MHGHKKDVRISAGDQQFSAQQGSLSQVEDGPSLFGGPVQDLIIDAVGMAQVLYENRRVDVLEKLSLCLPVSLHKTGSKDLMPFDQGIEAGFQCHYIEAATDAMGEGNIVEGIVGFEAIEEPQAFLREGEFGSLICFLDACRCRRRGQRLPGCEPVDVCAQGADRGVAKQIVNRHVQFEMLPHP